MYRTDPSNVLMRRANPSDTDKLGIFFIRNDRSEVTHFFKPFPLSMETAKRLLHPDRKDHFFLMEQGDKLIAFSMLRGWDEGYDIPSFGILVDFEYQRHGFGKQLSEWTFRWADNAGLPKIRLSVYEKNSHAVALYKNSGFNETERKRDSDGNIIIVMQRMRQDSKIKVFASTQALASNESLADRLSKWSEVGINRIELSNYAVGSADEFLSAALFFPGELLLHHFFPAEKHDLVLNLASSNLTTFNETLHFFKRSIEWSARIGAPFFSFHAGYISNPIGRDKYGFVFNKPSQKDNATALSRFAEAVQELSKYAIEHGIFLLIENNVVSKANKGKLLLSKPDEFEKLFNKISKYNNVGILLDWGHWRVTAKTYRLNMDSFSSLRKHIYGIHLHTNNCLADEHLPYAENDPYLDIIKYCEPKYVTLEGKYQSLPMLQQNIIRMERAL